MITLQDIYAARERVAPYVKRTPQMRSETLSCDLGTNVHIKYELFQKTGSFKPRGAFNQILALSEDERKQGVVGVSGGNFAQGLAYAGATLGVDTLICMPVYTPQNYIDATRGYGAQAALAPTMAETFALAERLHEEGRRMMHPFDSPAQMAGSGVIGLEILEDLPETTDVFVSIGGGGLLAGVTVALKSLKPSVRVWGVETEGSDTMGQALRAGRVVEIVPASLAKTLGAPWVSEDALRIAQEHLEQHITVSDREAFDALLYLLERAKVITELADSCNLAAARRVKERFSPDDQVVLLLAGGNTSLDNMIEYKRVLNA
jgi:threonine dehydratase